MTDFERNELKWELETYAKILEEKYVESENEIERANKANPFDMGRYKQALYNRGRQYGKLHTICQAMEIVDKYLELGLDIPEKGKLIRP